MIVKNHASEIEKALHLDAQSVCHEGNYHFSGRLAGHKVLINTEPADEEQETVNIYSVEIAETVDAPKQATESQKPYEVLIESDTRTSNGWIQGKVFGNGPRLYKFWAKVYADGSRFGINGGRISKLTIRVGDHEVMNYDRGWDRKPATDEERTVYNSLLITLDLLDPAE